MMDTSDEWIRTRTGIQKKHTVGETNMGPADLAVKASELLFKKYSINKEDELAINLEKNFLSFNYFL